MSVHCLVFANAARVCRLFSECVNTAHYCRTQSSVVSGWRRASTSHRPRTPFHCTWRPAPSPLTHAHLESHSADIISATGRRAAENMGPQWKRTLCCDSTFTIMRIINQRVFPSALVSGLLAGSYQFGHPKLGKLKMSPVQGSF